MQVLLSVDAVLADKPGGAQTVAWEQARRLRDAGHEVTILTAGHGDFTLGTSETDGIRIVRHGGAGHAFPYVSHGYRSARRLFAKDRYDVFHSHFAYASLGPGIALPPGAPRVRTFHGPWHEEGKVERDSPGSHPEIRGKGLRGELKFRLRRWIERFDLSRSQAVIVLSDYAASIASGLGVQTERLRVIPGGANIERFPARKDLREARRRLELPADARILLSVRRLTARMGLENLIDAMQRVIRLFPDALLVVGGKGPEESDLKARVANLSLERHVRFAGFIPDEDLPAYYQAADLFVLPTIALEGFGLVTVEALSSGTPVLGTPVGATPELLAPLDKRLLTRDASASALAEGIEGFFQDEWRKGLTPERLHQYVESRYTWKRHVDGVLAVYDELRRKNRLQAGRAVT